MALSDSFFGLRSGSTQSLTFQPRMMTLNEARDRSAYAQMTADRFQGTKNDNPSDAQLMQWAIFANISHAKSLLRGKLAGCFGCVSSKEAEKKFWQENKDGEQIIGAFPKQFLYSPIANYRFGDDSENPLVFKSVSYDGMSMVENFKYDRHDHSSLSELFPNNTKLITLEKIPSETNVTINNASFTVFPTSIEVYTINIPSIIALCTTDELVYGDKYNFSYYNGDRQETLTIFTKSMTVVLSLTRYTITNDFLAACSSNTIGFCLLPYNRKTGLYHGSWIRCVTEVIGNKYITLEQAAESWRPDASFSYRYLNGGDEGFNESQIPFPY